MYAKQIVNGKMWPVQNYEFQYRNVYSLRATLLEIRSFKQNEVQAKKGLYGVWPLSRRHNSASVSLQENVKIINAKYNDSR